MKVEFSNLAHADFDSVYEYYLVKAGKDVASSFETELRIKVRKMIDSFEAAPWVKDSTRKPRNKKRRFLIMDSFPYNIYYRIETETNTLHIGRILHSSRNIPSLLKE